MAKMTFNRPRVFVLKDGAIASDLRCVKCKYNLREVAQDSKCPECGALVSDSVGAAISAYPWTWFQRGVSGAAILIGMALPILNVVSYLPWHQDATYALGDVSWKYQIYWFLLGLACVPVLAIAAFHRRFNFWCLLIVSLVLLEASIASVTNAILGAEIMASILTSS